MYHVNEAYKQKVTELPQNYQMKIEVVFDESTGLDTMTIPPEDIFEAGFSENVFLNNFCIGSSVRANFWVRIFNENGKYRNDALATAEIRPRVTLYDDAGEVVDTVPVGVFYVDQLTVQNNDLRLDCFDKMQYLEKLFVPQETECWFDETNGEKLVDSWYTFWGVSKPTAETAIGTYYPKENLNVRSGAGVSYSVVETNGAKYNTAYAVYEIKRVGSQDWGRIGTNRWICLAYCSTAPISAANPAHKGTAYTITCDWLNVRKSPSTSAAVVGKYSKGQTFYVVAQKGDWCQLESGNWMCAGKYLKKV